MAYTREGTASYDPTTNRVNKNSSPMDKAYDDLVAAIAESNYRRTKSSDTSRMNKVYKPKASPGPIGSSANVREGRSPDRSPRPNRANAREDRATKPKSNFTYSAPKADKAKPNPNRANVRENRVASKPKAKAKSKTTAGFTKGSVGERAISSFKKAYLGK